MSWINTVSGKKVDLINPSPESICIDDIANGLSNLCRFTGQIREFYSVAEHSINVAILLKRKGMPKSAQLVGLLHDSTEAYIGDVTSPLKAMLPEYKKVEAKVEHAIMRRFGILDFHHEFRSLVKHCDLTMLHAEGQHFYGRGVENMWSTRLPEIPFETPMVRCLPPEEARQEFLTWYDDLIGQAFRENHFITIRNNMAEELYGKKVQ